MAFNLSKYEHTIRNYAAKQNVDIGEALNRFIYNLAVMRPHFDQFDESIDFRQLGQLWNKLSSDERNKQKAEMLNVSTRPTKLPKGV